MSVHLPDRLRSWRRPAPLPDPPAVPVAPSTATRPPSPARHLSPAATPVATRETDDRMLTELMCAAYTFLAANQPVMTISLRPRPEPTRLPAAARALSPRSSTWNLEPGELDDL